MTVIKPCQSYRYYVRLMQTFETAKAEDDNNPYLPLLLSDDPVAVEAVRYLVWKQKGTCNSLSGLVMNDVSGLPAAMDFMCRDISGNLFIDTRATSLSEFRHKNMWMEQRTGLVLRSVTPDAARHIVALGIKEFLMSEFSWMLCTKFGGEMTPEKYGLDKPLQITDFVIKRPDGSFAENIGTDGRDIPPEAKIMFTWNELNCIYDILEGKSEKKLTNKYKELYARLASQKLNPMEDTVIHTVLEKLNALEHEIVEELQAENLLVENFKTARKAALLARSRKKAYDILEKARKLSEGNEEMKHVFQVMNDLESMKDCNKKTIDSLAYTANAVTVKDFPEIALE